MPPDCFFARRDEGLETQCLSFCAFSRMGFSRRELADGKSKGIEAYLPLVGSKRMRSARFRWTQLQPHLCQPLRYPFGPFLHLFSIGVKQDKIVGVPHQERLFDRMAFRIPLRNRLFHPMK